MPAAEIAEPEAVEALVAAPEAADEASAAAPEAALAQASAALPSVSEPVSAPAVRERPSLILPFAVVLGLGVLGIWLAGRQTSA